MLETEDLRATRSRWLLCIVALLVVPFLSPSRTAGTPASSRGTVAALGPAGSVPTGLPAHVMLGLGNGPRDLGWMTGSGAHWDARYQYLAGGVATGRGWATWARPAGAFALQYMQQSSAHGYLPVFSYYMMLQSSKSQSGSERDRDLAIMNDPAVMRAYYADFTLLMRQAHAYGKPVIVHVEPDLWGYIEQKAGSCGRASCVAASVALSGNADVAAYPNTAQGFAEALLHLRDRYAPRVLMALHASCWGSGVDVCNWPSSLDDTAARAAQDATFLVSLSRFGRSRASPRSWDLVFTDTSDRDAGYYEHVYGNSHTWWDPTDRTLPSFANFRTWVAGINVGTGRRIVLWQTPVGNQYFATENNTTNHYQDNRAEYFLGDGPGYRHLRDFGHAGVVGVLFGMGGGGVTSYTAGDTPSSTQPAPVVSYHCDRCNRHSARYSDGDGGYLRLFGGRYLRAGGVPVPPPHHSGGTRRRRH